MGGAFNPYSIDSRFSFGAFNEQIVAQKVSEVSLKQIAGTAFNELVDDQQVSGSGTSSTYSSTRSSRNLSISSGTAGVRELRTKYRLYYEPGKGGRWFQTFVMGNGATGVSLEAGLADDDNGFLLKNVDTNLSFTVRNNGTDIDIPQGSWNTDILDGSSGESNPSGINLDKTKIQIFGGKFQWLGAGIVDFGFEVDGKFFACHQQRHANIIDSVYTANPQLPLRWRIEGDGSNPDYDFEAICGTAQSEGFTPTLGIPRTIMRLQDFDQDAANVWYPILGLRLKSGSLNAIVKFQVASILSEQNGYWAWGLFLNPTVNGTDNAAWTSLGANSAIEYDQSRTTANFLDDDKDRVRYGGFVSAQQRSDFVPINIDLPIGTFIDGTSDEFVLAIRTTAATGDDYYCSITVQELI